MEAEKQHLQKNLLQSILKNFWNLYRSYAKIWQLIYNGSEGFIQIAYGHSTLNYTIIDERMFSVFMEVQNEKRRI